MSILDRYYAYVCYMCILFCEPGCIGQDRRIASLPLFSRELIHY